ncbi:Late competence development protein ComFB [Caprobacter fermentans]|uniref:Late competence development ComFB family protein n=1 Tax=Caproicibacter fermentans TaxID=2576756 RepID=A0A6N8HUN7_9FIRM|nr:late competence development ComFB family protein [Caproicibacter fermentans]MVB09412.1 Late competence development protein ComFB [Caproicibacter fermentans]OCN02938.1 competence protein ComF [Clostridium sp. W14A]QNK41515.1 late competence development ComFB family protein [Caproicibacter fermentans]
MKIVNVTESLAEQKLDEIIDSLGCCKCDQCRADIISYALNRLSPKYVSTDIGRAYVKLDTMSSQFEVDLLAALYEAAEKVKKNPRHH